MTTTPSSGKRAVLMIVGGVALLAFAAGIWHENSLAIVHILLWPFVMLATVTNLKPEDIKPEQMLIGAMLGGCALGAIIGLVSIGVRKLQQTPRH